MASREGNTLLCFHGTCKRFANSLQAMWVNPKMQQLFLPAILPQFDQNRDANHVVHNLCIIVNVMRREYRLKLKYMSNPRHLSGMQFHHSGGGEFKSRLRRFTAIHSIPNYTEVLTLMTRTRHAGYFEGTTRLSGSVAAAY